MNTKNTVPTDSAQKITVESQLVYTLWTQGRAYAGFEAEFEVKTLLLGDGAKVKATCFTEKGKKLGKVEGTLVLNRFKGKVLIPETVKPDDYVYLDVEVAKIGIKGESNSIPVRPPLQAKSIKWDKKEARRDDEVKLTCEFTNGVEEGDAVSVIIYEYDRDGNHDKVITIPTTIKKNKVELTWQFLYQEDTDEIPTEDELKKYGKHYNPPEYFFVVVVDNIPVGRKQESGILRFLDTIEFFVRDHKGVAVADKTYTVTFADGKNKKGKLDDKGYVKLADVPAGPFFLEVEGMPPLKVAAPEEVPATSTKSAETGTDSASGRAGGDSASGGAGTPEDEKQEEDPKETVIVRDGVKVPFFYQLDEKWKDEKLGSVKTIGQAGCCVSSIAMILKFYGREVTPKTLDAYLDTNSGYTGDSVYIDTALKFKDDKGKKLKSSRVTSGFKDVLDNKIKANIPTIARVKYGSSKSASGDHFVVIVGKTADGKYIMNDPGASNGNGADNPSSENIVEDTKRKSGYTIVRLDCIVEND